MYNKRAFISKQSYFITEVDDEFLTLSRHTLKVADLNNSLSELQHEPFDFTFKVGSIIPK